MNDYVSMHNLFFFALASLPFTCSNAYWSFASRMLHSSTVDVSPVDPALCDCGVGDCVVCLRLEKHL